MGSLDLQIIVIRARVLTTMLASLIVIGCSLLTHVDYVRKITQNCYHPTRIRDEGGVYCIACYTVANPKTAMANCGLLMAICLSATRTPR